MSLPPVILGTPPVDRILTCTPEPRLALPYLSDAGRDALTALVLSNQHPIRFWEYGHALTALEDWIVWDAAYEHPHAHVPYRYADLGAAGSPFHKTLRGYTAGEISVVDPALPESFTAGEHFHRDTHFVKQSAEDFALACVAAGHRYDAVFSISVIEHHPTPITLLRAAYNLLRPGGLCVLTMDCWDCHGPDTAHFHWMRKRIYNPDTVGDLLDQARKVGFRQFGRADWAYHGHTVHNYSVMALVLVRDPLRDRVGSPMPTTSTSTALPPTSSEGDR